MSLQHVARHLASKGRGEDTTLVHMTPREVKGLQALAMAHGGSLTINPQTGLPEAGFLSRLLPMIAGAALASTGIGAPMAAAMIGGGTALAKGDLKAGLMAGLGAYGGAGLMGGAATMGAQAAGEAAGANTLGTTPAAMATEAGSQAALTNTVPAEYANMDPNAGSNFIDPAKAQQYSQSYANAAKPTFANTQVGIQNAFNDPSKYVDTLGGGAQAATYGISALAPSISTDRQMLPTEDPYSGPLSKYKFDPNQYRPSDRSQPNPYYTPRRYDFAGGGPVEQMSNANAIGANTGYPMADINKAAYSTPYQTPISQNVVQGDADTGVNPMTGEQTRFAEGGITGSGNLDLHIPLDLGGGGQQGGGGFGGGQGGGAFGVGNGGNGQSRSAFGQGFEGNSMPGFSGGQPPAFGGGFGGMGATAQQNPFANDENFNNYQNQMNSMVSEFQNSDQYKNMDQLRQTMLNYQQQRLGTAGSASLDTPSIRQPAVQTGENINGGAPRQAQAGASAAAFSQLRNMLGGTGMGAYNPGLYSGQAQKQSYDQYLAARHPLQQDVQLTREQYENPTPPANAFASRMAEGGMAYASGGISSLGSYSDGGRMLKGPGDGMSDNIPAQIGSKQPARLADGEFVVPADVVSHLGNGSTDAGARQLYGMMDRIRAQRTGKKKQAPRVNPSKAMPA